jgi:hypothetical protein
MKPAMKSKLMKFGILTLVFSLFLVTSCGEKKNETVPDAQEEKSISKDHDSHGEESSSEEGEGATAEYQCPMDCEDGKTYAEAGSCPVCKMDLKAQNTAEVMSCKKGKDGKCACKKEECKCKNCPNRS